MVVEPAIDGCISAARAHQARGWETSLSAAPDSVALTMDACFDAVPLYCNNNNIICLQSHDPAQGKALVQ